MSIGQVYYDVLPDFSKFAAAAQAGLGNQKPVKIRVDADTAKAKANIDQLIASNSKLDASSRRVADARGRLAIAEARLAEAQSKAGAGSARVIAAQEAVAKSARGVTDARERNAAQALRATAATERAAAREAAAVERAANRQIAARQRVAAAAAREASGNAAAGQVGAGKVGTGLLVAGAAVAATFGAAATVTARFEKSVSAVAATSGEAKKQIGTLRAEAIKYGADTAFSATEAADAQAELIKANVSVADTINGGLSGALDLAAAGSLGVADAAGIMATAMSQFKIPGEQAGHVADLLAAAAGKAQGEVGDFAGALKYVGPNAKAAGVSIEETVGALALLADQGIKGEQAGTNLRSMLVSLTAPVGAGAAAMQQYGINVRDASGNFVGLGAAAGELQDKLGGLGVAERDAALARIFGKNSLTAATVLYSGGAASVQQWTDAVNDSGFASEVAKTKMDNLSGDVEKLGGAFQSTFINIGSSSQGPLRVLTQGLTGVVDGIGKLATTGGGSAAAIGIGLAGAALIGAGGVLKLATAANGAKVALAGLSVGARAASIAAGAVGVGLAAATAVVGHFVIEQGKAAARTDDLTQSLIASKGVIDATVASQRADVLEKSGALKAAEKLGVSIEDVTQASLGNVEAQDRVNAKLKTYAEVSGGLSTDLDRVQHGQNGVADAARAVSEAVNGGNRELDDARGAYQRQSQAAEAAAGGMKNAGSAAIENLTALSGVSAAIGALGSDASASAGDVNALTQAIYGQANAALSAQDAELGYRGAVIAAKEAAKQNGKTLSDNTAKGVANQTALSNLAKSQQAYVTAAITGSKGTKEITRRATEARASFIEQAKAMGATAGQARKMANEYGLVPKEVKTKIKAELEAQQQAKLASFIQSLEKLPEDQAIRVKALVDKGDLAGAERLVSRLAKKQELTINPKVNNPAAAKAKKGLDYFGNPITAPVKAKADTGKAKGDLDGVTRKKRSAEIGVKVNTGKAKKEVADVKGSKINVDVKANTGKAKASVAGIKGVKVNVTISANTGKARAAIAAIKGVKVNATVSPKGIPGVVKAIAGIKDGKASVKVSQSGVGSVQSSINGVHGKTVYIDVVKRTKNAGGGTVPGHAGGGTVRGLGGPREDRVYGIDRATGTNSVMVSPGEEIVNAYQSARNRTILKQINAGGMWDVVPRRATGGGVPGPVGRTTGHGATRTGERGRPIVIHVDLGPDLGGIRTIIADEIEASGEYAASVNRMRHHG